MGSAADILVRNPRLAEAREHLEAALAARRVILLVGQCRVIYKGRASSELTDGDRVLLMKTDGSVLVHRPFGYESVNWQPSKCLFKTTLRDRVLTIRATRVQPKETLTILFSEVASLGVYNLEDSGVFSMYVSEEQMRQAILLDPSLVEDGIRPLAEEKRFGDAGFTDVLAEDAAGNLVVIEIKRDRAGRDAVLQLRRYVDEIARDAQRPLRGVLASPGLRKGAQRLLESLKFEFRRVAPERCYDVLRRHDQVKISDYFDSDER